MNKTAVIMSKEEAMALPLKERPLCYRLSSSMYHDVFQFIGEASMAWKPRPGNEVFDSELASDIAVRFCFRIAEELESQKSGTSDIEDRRDFSFVETFNMMSEQCAEIAESKGWESPTENLPGFIALCHSEISEALEGFRHGDPPSDHIPEFSASEEELADSIIRIMHYRHKSGARIAQAVLAKMVFNKTREHKHGGKKF